MVVWDTNDAPVTGIPKPNYNPEYQSDQRVFSKIAKLSDRPRKNKAKMRADMGCGLKQKGWGTSCCQVGQMLVGRCPKQRRRRRIQSCIKPVAHAVTPYLCLSSINQITETWKIDRNQASMNCSQPLTSELRLKSLPTYTQMQPKQQNPKAFSKPEHKKQRPRPYKCTT